MVIQILIIQVITFAGLIFVLRILFFRQLNSALSRLKALHQENLKKEAELKKEMEIIKKQRDQELAQAREDATRILKEAKEKSERMNFDVHAQASSDARKILEDAKMKLRVLENDLKAKYAQDAVRLAEQVFEAVFTAQGKEHLHHMLLMELVEEIRTLPADKFNVSFSSGVIISAHGLNDEQRQKIYALISEKKGGAAVGIDERVDPEIIAGLIIQLGPLVLDGSLRNKLNKAIVYLSTRQSGA